MGAADGLKRKIVSATLQVLFVLLLASSCGSFYSYRLSRWFWLLPVVLAAFIFVSPAVTRGLTAASTPVRIAISALLLFPSGFFMGMAFPLGMQKALARHDGAPTAWYWGINGAFSVISSVLAVVVAVFWGVTMTLLMPCAKRRVIRLRGQRVANDAASFCYALFSILCPRFLSRRRRTR